MNTENAVLITLLSQSPMTVGEIHARIPDAASWREVANAVNRLATCGWVAIADERAIGEDVHPMFSLTAAGDLAARQIRSRAQLAEERS